MKVKKMLAIMLMIMGVLVVVSCGKAAEETVESLEPVELVVPEVAEVPEKAEEPDTEEAEEPRIEETEDGQEAEILEGEEPEEENVDETSSVEKPEAEPVAKEEPAINWDDITKLDTPVTMYAQGKLNIRKGPDTTFDSVGKLAINDAVQVIGNCNSSPWKEIQFKDGVAFVHGGYLSEEQIDLEALQAAQAEAAAVAQAAAEAAAAEEQQEATAPQQETPAPQPEPAPQPDPPTPQPEVPEPAGILFIGDSRTCQMQVATQGAGCSWICEYGTKYEWFENTAIPKADKLIGQGTKVVICMGVNDPGSCRSYASLTNSKASVWRERGATVYYVSLNPVAEPYEDKTPAIDNFNASMPGLLSGVNWIDTASTVKQGGYVLVDGIHYDAVSNVNIFNLICGRL